MRTLTLAINKGDTEIDILANNGNNVHYNLKSLIEEKVNVQIHKQFAI